QAQAHGQQHEAAQDEEQRAHVSCPWRRAPPATHETGTAQTRAPAEPALPGRRVRPPPAKGGRGRSREAALGGVGSSQVSSTSCVCVTTAQSFPSSDVIVVCQTIVVRPRCSATDSPTTVVFTFAPPMNLVLESVVVVRLPCGRLITVPTAPSVSAKAM